MDPALAEHLVRLETALARRDPGLVDEPLPELVATDFTEHGASGGRWGRDDAARIMAAGPPSETQLEEVSVTTLADGAALLTYRSVDPTGRLPDAWRASIWVRREDGWRMLFHQGTRLPEDNPEG